MDEDYDYFQELRDFLGGTFHQDISSPEQALDEYINEANKECLHFTIRYCDEFLTSNRTKQEKEIYIQTNAEIYFPAIGLTSLIWLNNVVEQIKEAVKSK
ncbi:contact-dependent growth inhibition system immunity protein [Peribacillus frigoritolerans]|uniref:contact-dependent growth inhibition system immunity protein n=1 Tax=Peribacillus frigoritolerans TaxID=450367 RepID=UPI002B24B6B0|nr:contact-dependent growth inhibition system immunity protein [Peribacillus frigoritolerans]MEB2631534.1 contact-dependent growth inhibition system immunity protein [Peribacillus frigoritolerans]